MTGVHGMVLEKRRSDPVGRNFSDSSGGGFGGVPATFTASAAVNINGIRKREVITINLLEYSSGE